MNKRDKRDEVMSNEWTLTFLTLPASHAHTTYKTAITLHKNNAKEYKWDEFVFRLAVVSFEILINLLEIILNKIRGTFWLTDYFGGGEK